MDYTYTTARAVPRLATLQGFRRPASDFFRANVFASFQQDPYGLRLLDVIGHDTPTWGVTTPHRVHLPEEPRDRGQVVADLSEDDGRRVATTICADLYGFELP